MHVLFGSQGSGSAAIEMALGMAGLDYRVVRASTWEPDSALDELAAANPLRQIPTLQLPDGSVLSESAAILIHLGLTQPGSGLLPADPVARAQTIRGLVYIAANCYAAIGVCDHPERWCADIDRSARGRILRGARAQLHRSWEVFADQFPARPWLGGAQLGALDLLAAVVSSWSGARAHLTEARPEFLATLRRIDAHAAVAPVWARHWPTGDEA